jgi:hypothetical protein
LNKTPSRSKQLSLPDQKILQPPNPLNPPYLLQRKKAAGAAAAEDAIAAKLRLALPPWNRVPPSVTLPAPAALNPQSLLRTNQPKFFRRAS